MFTININLRFESHLGAVMVSVLGTRPEVCGLNPGQGDGFLRAIKTFLQRGSKPEAPCRPILWHVKNLLPGYT
jgi:hypothetical protein